MMLGWVLLLLPHRVHLQTGPCLSSLDELYLHQNGARKINTRLLQVRRETAETDGGRLETDNLRIWRRPVRWSGRPGG